MSIFSQIYKIVTTGFLNRIFKYSNEIAGVQDEYYRELLGEMIRREIANKYERLIQNLDERSREIVNITIEHLIDGMTVRNGVYSSLSSEQTENLPLYNAEKKQYAKTKLNPPKYLPEVFYYHHGLRFCSENVRQYVANKYFLDCGAYIGDSAIVLAQYSPKQILCYEFVESTIKLFRQNIEKNHLTDKVSLQSYALGNVANTASSFTGSGASFSIMNKPSNKQNYSSVPFEIKRMDDCISRDASVGFIKADVEGALLDVLMGGRETIIKNRPVLSLAVYHSPTELFESKPYLESILNDYIYEYHHFNFSTKFQSELNLFAYPKEIIL